MSAGANPTSESIEAARFRDVLGHFATGVTVVTAMDGEPVGFTCQAFAALSLDPPLVLLAPAKSSTSWPRIAQAGAFCVNILAAHQGDRAQTFSISGADKFAGVEWRPGPVTGSPVFPDALAWVECRLEAIYDSGDHELVTGRVLALDVTEREPLLYFRGGFGGFSA